MKSKVKSQKSKILIILIGSLLLSGCFRKEKPEDLGLSGIGEGVKIEDRVSRLSDQFGITIPETIDKALLSAVDGSFSSGLATREITPGGTTYTILANLPDLIVGYTARLVNGQEKYSLGSLRVSKGGWLLEKQVVIDSEAFNTVEILNQEGVVLRGSF